MFTNRQGFPRTQIEMPGGVKRSTEKYGDYSGLWVLNGSVKKVGSRM